MSLLVNSLSSLAPQLLQEQDILKRVNAIVQAPQQILQSIYFTWAKAFNDLHGNEELRPILLEKIGPAATELFVLNGALTTFMISSLSGIRNDIVQDIQHRLSTLPQFTYHPDGTVTVGVSSLTPELTSTETTTPEPSSAPLETITTPNSSTEMGTVVLSSTEINTVTLSSETPSVSSLE